jgi:GR25 family glycosyltransferase involved in LPS biosynthesis
MFGARFVINLDGANERLARVSARLAAAGIADVERIPGVLDEKDGHRGCALAHFNVFERIVRDRLPSALVFEDDVILRKDAGELLARVEKQLEWHNWHICWLGAGIASNNVPLYVEENLVCIDRAFLMHAYIVSAQGARWMRDKLDTLLSLPDDKFVPFDFYCARFPLFRLATNPVLAVQERGQSLTAGRSVNNTPHIFRFFSESEFSAHCPEYRRASA